MGGLFTIGVRGEGDKIEHGCGAVAMDTLVTAASYMGGGLKFRHGQGCPKMQRMLTPGWTLLTVSFVLNPKR